MSIPAMKCERCTRDSVPTAEKWKPLEICWSSRHNQWRCMSCHFTPTQAEIDAAQLKAAV